MFNISRPFGRLSRWRDRRRTNEVTWAEPPVRYIGSTSSPTILSLTHLRLSFGEAFDDRERASMRTVCPCGVDRGCAGGAIAPHRCATLTVPISSAVRAAIRRHESPLLSRRGLTADAAGGPQSRRYGKADCFRHRQCLSRRIGTRPGRLRWQMFASPGLNLSKV